MTRIIRSDSPARARTGLVAAIQSALADLSSAGNAEDARDRLAYAGLALRELDRSTERTAQAWERRGYWVKVDQFRREWGWAGQGAEAILTPLLKDDLQGARAAARDLLPRLHLPEKASTAKAPSRMWVGAFARWKADPRAPHGR